MEFGTANPLTILLQRNGFSLESAIYIRDYKDEYVVHDGDEEDLKLKSSLLHCGNTSVMTEAASIKYNVPGLFIDDESEPDEIDEGLSFVRTIQCPECNAEFEVDLVEYVYDVSRFEKDNGMGPMQFIVLTANQTVCAHIVARYLILLDGFVSIQSELLIQKR